MKFLRVCMLAMLVGGAMLVAAAQSKPGGGGASTGTAGNTPTPRLPTSSSIPSPTSPSQRDMRPFFLSGSVVLEDGTPPSSRVDIQRVCGVSMHREGSADSNGSFSFQINPQQPEMSDPGDIEGPMMTASANGDPSASLIASLGAPTQTDLASALQMCDIRASLAGYVSDRIPLAGKTMDRMIDLGTIVLHPMGVIEGTTISVTSMKAPKAARKLVENGRKKGEKQKFPEALEAFQKAVQIDPQYAEAWFYLGEAQQRLKNEPEALKAYQQALIADGKYVRPYMALAQIAAEHRDWQGLANTTDKLLALDAVDYPVAFYYNSAAYYNLHKTDLAEKSALRAERLDSQHRMPKVNLLLADILVQRHDYSGAADQIRTFLKYSPQGPDADAARADLDKLTKMGAANPAVAPPQQQK